MGRRFVGIQVLLLLFLLGCGSDDPSGPSGGGDRTPARVSLSQTSLTLTALGDSARLTATVEDQEGRTISNATISWVSTDTTVASVGSSGWVVARGDGSASIVATAGPASDTATVEVVRAHASIVLSTDTLRIGEGDTTRITAVVRDSSDLEIPGAEISWVSLDPSVATVDTAGLVRAQTRGGRTWVVATSGEASDSVRVEVWDQILYVSSGFMNVVNEDGSGRRRIGDVNAEARFPAWSPDGSKIAYVKSRFVGGTRVSDIFVINANGSGERQLTNSGSDTQPTWSPDGSRIAFISRRDGAASLYVMNAGGTDQTRVTHSGRAESQPVWAPSGNKIVLQRNMAPGNMDIIVVDVSTGGETNVSNNSADDREPTWALNGTRVLYRSDRVGGVWQLYSVAPDGSDNKSHLWGTAIGYNITVGSWSPDGQWLVFELDEGGPRRIFLRGMGANPVDYIEIEPDAGVDRRTPKWAPAGDKILYLRRTDRPFREFDILVTTLDGSRVTKAAETDGVTPELVVWRPRPRP